ncbi:S8 family serine peptidase [Actibacterium pelagium]|uniref:Peptidase S8/S53 domain-containing protein n=1 Tax=Actibacterium pelagium TaxID=2029103 RepID=A0A917ADI7_9RHOB|nr:S8 family serine peptidase [Actibacterium pelagium]GGE44912.1 hypothetical protein GCM10011517_10650 [Actibacterium pelagium]
MTFSEFLKSGFMAAAAFTILTSDAEAKPVSCADDPTQKKCKGGDDDGDTTPPPPPPTGTTADLNWMHSDVGLAHDENWTGVGSRITVVDDFLSGSTIKGRLEVGGSLGELSDRTHGEWTSLIASLVAPGADFEDNMKIDFNSSAVPTWDPNKFDVVNLSYGITARASFAGVFNDWSYLGAPHEAVLQAVDGNLALAVQSAGNDGNDVAIGDTVKGKIDVFGQQFVRIIEVDDVIDETTGLYTYMAPVIFAGALEWNPDGAEGDDIDGEFNTEAIASYSTIAGTNVDVQNHYLLVGVEGGRTATDALANYGSDCGSVNNGTCLYGTSFAAPIITGYAAIVAHKFTDVESLTPPAPSLVAQQLLDSARITTITDYSPAIHGRGEACLSCALAPIGAQ